MKKRKTYTPDPATAAMILVADGIGGKVIHDQDDPRTAYVETDDGLRLIFRDGKYAGFYTPNLAETLN